jgi:branched-chain amino acid transport system substrate-binding protein
MVAVATTDAILLTRHAKEIGVAPRAYVGFGGGFGVEEFAKELGPLSQNVFSSAPMSGNPNDPAAREFYKKFEARYNIHPKEHEVEGYAIVYIIADALGAPPSRKSGGGPRGRQAVAAQDRHDHGLRQGEVRQLGRSLGDKYTNRTSTRRITRCWRSG